MKVTLADGVDGDSVMLRKGETPASDRGRLVIWVVQNVVGRGTMVMSTNACVPRDSTSCGGSNVTRPEHRHEHQPPCGVAKARANRRKESRFEASE